MRFGFVYLWYDKKQKKFYLGSHLGQTNDGYIGSNHRLQCAFKSRPETFKRRILESYENITAKQLLQREQLWLNLIRPEELSIKYYNEKKVASGGNIIGNLSEEKRKQHSIKSGIASKKYWDNITPKEMQKRKQNAFGGNTFSRDYLKLRNKELCSKKAIIQFPNGTEKVVINISEFCLENNLNYGNMKTMLRGKRKSCNGFKGNYI
jgi:hypothetical protein